jgi:hypothetical protein
MHSIVEELVRARDYNVTESMDVLWGFRDSGVGFVIAETTHTIVVASVPLVGLTLSQGLVDQLGETNQRLPLGGAFLARGGENLNCCWTSVMQKSWLDFGGDAVLHMLVDTIGNAAGLTNRIMGDLAQFGGHPVDPSPDYFSMLIAGMALA